MSKQDSKEKNVKRINDVVSIKGQIRFHGQGGINYDGPEQAKHLADLRMLSDYSVKGKENVKYHKKIFKVGFADDGKPQGSYKFKVSGGCLRNIIFKDEMSDSNTVISQIPYVFFNSITSPAYLIRGYMSADKDVKETTGKRKSAFTITDAVAEMDWTDKIHAEFYSRAGSKKTVAKSVNDGKSDTSIHSMEMPGEYDYTARFAISMDDMQFISLDPVLGRMGAELSKKQNRKMYMDALKRNIPTESNAEIRPYYKNSVVMGEYYAEDGILLTEETVNMFIHKIIDNIKRAYRTAPSSNGILNFVSMEMTIHTANSDDVVLEILPDTDISKIFFKYKKIYEAADIKRISERNIQMTEIENATKERAQEKKEKKETRKTKKLNKDVR